MGQNASKIITTSSISISFTRKMGNGRVKRLVVIGLGLLIIFLGSVLLLYPSPDLSAEQEIVHRIAELTAKLQHANGLNDQRKSDLQLISGQFGSLVRLVKEHQDQYEDNKSPLNALLAEYTKQGLTNPNFTRSFDLTLPSVTAFLPNTVCTLLISSSNHLESNHIPIKRSTTPAPSRQPLRSPEDGNNL